MSNILGVIRRPAFGVLDKGQVGLSFTVNTLEGSVDLFIIEYSSVIKTIKDANVLDVHDLEGKACVVEYDRGIGKFISIANNI